MRPPQTLPNKDEEPADPRRWWSMFGVGLAVFMATLDASIVNISLPTLVTSLKTEFATVEWVIIAYVLVVTSLMLTMARMGDMWGKKKIYSSGLALFTLGSLCCGLSPSVGWLIAARAMQGVGAAMLQSLGAAILTEVFPNRERGKAMGAIGGIVSLGLAMGPPLGGLIIGLVGWRPIFLINVPLGVLAGFIIWRFVPNLPVHQKGERFDLSGGLVLLITLTVYALAMTFGQRGGFAQPLVLGMLGGAALGMAVFLSLQAKKDQPMLDLTIFRNPLFSLNLIMGLVVFVSLAAQFVTPFFLELVMGYSITQVGFMMMVVPLMMGLLAIISGTLSDKLGPRWISVAGLAFLVYGCWLLATIPRDATMIGLVLRFAPFGIGMGLFQAPNNMAIMGEVPPQRLGVASGLMSFSRTMGTGSGVPLMGAIFAAAVAAHPAAVGITDAASAPPAALVAGYRSAYHVATGLVLMALVLGLAAAFIDHRRQARAKA